MSITEALRKAAKGKSVLSLSHSTGLHYNSLHGFLRRGRTLTLVSADKLAAVLNLELTPIKKRKDV